MELARIPDSQRKAWLRMHILDGLSHRADGPGANIASSLMPWTSRDLDMVFFMDEYSRCGVRPADEADAGVLAAVRQHIEDHYAPISLLALRLVNRFDPRPDDARAVSSWLAFEPEPTVRAAIATGVNIQGMGTMIDAIAAWVPREPCPQVQASMLHGLVGMLETNAARDFVGDAEGTALGSPAESWWAYDASALLSSVQSVGLSTSSVDVLRAAEAVALSLVPRVPGASEVHESLQARNDMITPPQSRRPNGH